ncbi:MAG: ABC transporter permease [Candidatus Korarchaeota archaeon]|nr:ABC transporter permease [Thermoproteota archaeon]MCR8463043.1 ABC transporter permease [Thermoproteota archaeon]MCR8470621.1 ABC transporter permease [Thermoproteota archaeon]MCR8471589.1 ABC transporter permease [Thermoproteota archaeon]MCR8473057.1 ABC transporter permease [Thermoproteota archaeon]
MSLKESLRSIWIITKYNLKVEMRYPLSYISSIFNLLFWFLAFGAIAMIFSSAPHEESTIISNIIMWGLASIIVFNIMISEVGYGIVRLQMRGTLEQVLLSPIAFWVLPLGLMTVQLLVCMFFIALVIVFMILLFEAPIIIVNPIGGIIGFILLLTMSYGISMFLAGMVIRIKRASWVLVQALTTFHWIFSGAFYRFSTVPSQILAVSRLIPLSYAIDVFRTSLMGLNPELIQISVNLLGYTIPGALVEWILTTLLSAALLVFGYISLTSAIKSGKRKGYLGQY